MPQHELLACAQCGCFAFSCFEDFAIRVNHPPNYLQEIPTFDETGSFTQFLEQGSTSRTYTGGSGTAFEIGGMYALLPRFSIGWSFEFLETMQDGTLDVSVPHPLLFNKSRDAAEPAVTSLSGSTRTISKRFQLLTRPEVSRSFSSKAPRAGLTLVEVVLRSRSAGCTLSYLDSRLAGASSFLRPCRTGLWMSPCHILCCLTRAETQPNQP